MRVICIDDYSKVAKRKFYHLKMGEIYETIGEGVFDDGVDCYIIDGLPPTYYYNRTLDAAYYAKKLFIPCSDIDETELTNIETLNEVV